MKLLLPAFADMHVHLRQGQMLESVCHWTKRYASHVLVMPNTHPPMRSASTVNAYRRAIKKCIGSTEPVMSLKLTDETTPAILRAAREEANCRVVKLYPKGVTHNSDDGVSRRNLINPSQNLWDCYETMADLGISLSMHVEMPGEYSLEREDHFLVALENFLALAPPALKVVLEHITTARAVEFVRTYARVRGNIAATITPHHMVMNHDDVMGEKLYPDNFCLPIPKHPRDQRALLAAATSGDECFFLGSDSAPHPSEKKRCAECCAGVYTAPILPELLAHIFEEADSLDKLPAFAAYHGSRFYELNILDNAVQLEWESSTIPGSYCGVVPFWSGKNLNWSLCA